jgi:hypothetical protein
MTDELIRAAKQVIHNAAQRDDAYTCDIVDELLENINRLQSRVGRVGDAFKMAQDHFASIIKQWQFASLEPWSIDGDKIVDGSGLTVCFMARDSNGLIDEGDADFIAHSGRNIQYLLEFIESVHELIPSPTTDESQK